jgi:hypothetical protein
MSFGPPAANADPPGKSGIDRARISATGLALCAIALVWAGIVTSLSAQREVALRGAATNAKNLARAFEEDMVRTFGSLDQGLRSLRRAYARSQASFDIMDWAAGLRALSDLDVHFAVLFEWHLAGEAMPRVLVHMTKAARGDRYWICTKRL